MSAKHALLSPSSAERWMECPGSIALIATLPPQPEDEESADSATFEGTVAHGVAAECLEVGVPANTFIGHEVTAPDGSVFTVTQDMCADVQRYVDFVETRLHAMIQEWEAAGQTGPRPTLHVEVKLGIHELTGEEGAHGTSDAVLVGCRRIEVIDLKFGRGVQKFAQGNWQLRMYALATLLEFLYTHEIDEVLTTIHQTRLEHVDECRYSASEMQAFQADLLAGAAATRQEGAARVPGDTQCRFCPAKAVCPDKRDLVVSTVWESPGVATPEDFEDMTAVAPDPIARIPEHTDAWLGVMMSNVDLVERWCKAVRAEVERRLVAGSAVPGHKLVQGKRGNRQWDDAAAVEAELKTMGLKIEERYDLKLISPTTAEKLQKAGAIGPRQWKKLQQRITQSEGKPSVAPASDPRPALSLSADASVFEDVSQPSS